MSLHQLQIAPPKAWDEFEDLCHALFKAEWRDSTTQKNGRQGQAQAGVDIFGVNHTQGNGLWGVTCKARNRSFGAQLRMEEIDVELAKADTFQPKLAQYIIATTAHNDVTLQAYVRQLSEQRKTKGLCPVSVFFWEQIEQLLFSHTDVTRRFYPEHFARLSQQKKILRLPAIGLSAFFSDPAGHLSTLRQQLQKSSSSAVLAAATLQGMGGVGKTQLALQYCLKFQHDYVAVWWFQAETTSLLEQECTLFCTRQGIPLAIGESASSAMRDWLTEQKNWLLVFDNVEDAKQLSAILPRGGGHHILITSRSRFGWPGIAKLELDVWLEKEALQFLRTRLEGLYAAEDEELHLLIQTLGGLPLALEQACAYIISSRVPIQAYCQRIQALDSAQRLLGREDSEFGPRSVFATLSLSFEKLSEPAKELLGICAWLAAKPIPEYLFTESPDQLPPSLRMNTIDEFAWRETVMELESYALCQAKVNKAADQAENGTEEVRCLNFHRLTQAAVRISGYGQNSGSNALMLVQAGFPYRADQPQHWPRCRTLEPHVLALQELYQDSWQQEACYATLLMQLATYLKSGRALLQQAESLERQVLLIRQTALGEEHPSTLTAINNLAATLLQMGDLPSSRALQEQSLSIYRRLQGEEHPETVAALNNLAATLVHMGDLPGARNLQEQVLDISRRTLGEEHPDTLTSMNHLADTLYQMGDLSGARVYQELALSICHHIRGEEHPDTLSAMDSLAFTLQVMSDLSAARALQEKSLAIHRRIQGEEHPDTLTALNNLATTFYDLGDFSAAQIMMEQAYRTLCHVLGEEHPYTLSVLNKLARTLRQTGDLPSAVILQEKALGIRRRIQGDEHPDTLISISNLAETLRESGDLPTARAMQEKAFEGLTRVLGEEHMSTLASMKNLATLLRQIGNLLDAQKLEATLAEILDRRQSQTGPNSANTFPEIINSHYMFFQENEDQLTPAKFRTLHRTWLQSVILSQFRCFETLQVDFSEQLTVLIAPNGAGKTAVLDGIAIAIGLFVQCFHGSKVTPLLETDARLIPTNRDLGLMEPQYPVTITTEGELDGRKFTLSYIRESPDQEPRLIGDEPLTKIGKAMQRAITRQEQVTLPLIALFGTSRLQKKIGASENIFDESFEPAYFSRTAGYKDCLDPGTNYKEFETWLTYAFRADYDAPTTENLDTAETGFAALLTAVRNAVDTCLATSGWRDLHLSRKRMRLVMKHPRQGELDIAQLSDGVRNMIALVADIAQRTVRLNPHLGANAAIKTPGLVLIDEIDLHLHPEWQQTVLTNLLEAFPNMQFVVTTHSPQVLTTVQPDCIRIIEWDGAQVRTEQPEFSMGAESQQLLRSLQGVNPRPQKLPITEKLNRYLELTNEDKWDSDEALALRSALDEWGKGYEPSLIKADMDIRLRAFRRERK